MRIGATIEARMASTRLPGKVMLPACGQPMLALMVERLRRAPSLDAIIIATTEGADCDPIAALAGRLGIGHWRGPEEDVLGRVLGAARAHGLDVIVELTGDCPLIDPALVEAAVAAWRAGGVDYVSNQLVQTYPLGMAVQVFPTDLLAEAAARTDDPADREHVSLYFYREPGRYRCLNLPAPPALTAPDLSVTLDTPQDLAVIRAVFEALYPADPAFDLAAIIAWLRANPAVAALNADVRRKAP